MLYGWGRWVNISSFCISVQVTRVLLFYLPCFVQSICAIDYVLVYSLVCFVALWLFYCISFFFVSSFLRSFFSSFFVSSFLSYFVPSFLRSFVPSSPRPLVPSSPRPFVPSSLRPFVPSSLRPFVPNFLCFFVPSFLLFSTAYPFLPYLTRPVRSVRI